VKPAETHSHRSPRPAYRPLNIQPPAFSLSVPPEHFQAVVKEKDRTIEALAAQVRMVEADADKAARSFAAAEVQFKARLAEAMLREEELVASEARVRVLDETIRQQQEVVSVNLDQGRGIDPPATPEWRYLQKKLGSVHMYVPFVVMPHEGSKT